MSDPTHALVLDADTHAVQQMHPLAAAILAANPDAATLRELLTLQRDWEAGEAHKAFTRALAGLKRDLPTVIQRDATVDFTNKAGARTRYTHATLAAVMDAVTEPLTQHGFSLAWTPRTTERGVEVTCRLTHAQGHHEEATLSAPADTSGSKNPAQAIASTVTLLSRYTALALLGIASADMQEAPEATAAAPAAVDTKRNLKAAAAITKHGLSLDAARSRVGGRGPAEWTSADLDVLRAWLTPQPPAREPGEDA